MNKLYLLAIAAAAVNMTTCTICALILWHLRKESRDSSRWLLALGAILSALISAFVLCEYISRPDITSIPTTLLQPWVGIAFMTMFIITTLYPIMVVNPGWLNRRRYFLLFLPVAVFAAAFLLFIGRWTPLPTHEVLLQQLGRPDVLVRLLALGAMVPYCYILLMLPFNYKRSSASLLWIVNYSLGLVIMYGLHAVFMLYGSPLLLIYSPLLVTVFYAGTTIYDIEKRLWPGREDTAEEEEPETLPDAGEEDIPAEFGLWSRVRELMEKEQVWRDPDLSLIRLAKLSGTNITYLGRIIQEETGKSFRQYVNEIRIRSVAKQLRTQPEADIQEAFFNAGFRSRTTAWRNFKDITGLTPSEYREKAKKED